MNSGWRAPGCVTKSKTNRAFPPQRCASCMTPERWQQIEELFRTVVHRPPHERDAHLTQICNGDEELRQEVLALLAKDTTDDVLRHPIANAVWSLAYETTSDLTNTRIGSYRLTRLLGHGGMGAVYEAVRDDDQFQQQVALKLIKRGMDTAFVRERFLRERQILASLDHPYIARLMDGGTTPDGQPYFVMEFVAGVPITEYCQQADLTLEEKLKLFRHVCSAVQHAHQKLVVHRDLKPGNILVTKEGTPKLLDFGIAKLLAADTGEAVTRTETALRLMTPDYASPEQVRGGTITTVTDVYALGVILYELLTKRRPHQFETYSPVAIERAICDTEAPRPSNAAREQAGASIKLARQLEGDLDNIVLMALRKEPERRYQSVEQLSEDLRRYLAGLPVLARTDTFYYRASKFVRRHRLAVLATGLVLISLLGGILATTLAARRARAERERASEERARAERRFAQVRALANTFLFDFHDKIENVPGTIEAREMVVKTALNYLDSLAAEAAGDAQLSWELAVAYHKVGDVQGDPWAANIGRPQEAIQSYRKGVALAQQLSDSGRNDLPVLRQLAKGYFKLGALQAQNGDQTSAQQTLHRALPFAEQLERQTHDLEDIRLLQNCHARLGDTALDTGDPVSALASYRRELRLGERRVVEFPSDRSQLGLGQTHLRIGEAMISLGDLPGAREAFRQGLSLIDNVMPRHETEPLFLRGRMIALLWLGHVSGNPYWLNLGETQSALQYYREHLAIAERLAARDPKNALAQQDLAGAHQRVAEVLSLEQPRHAIAEFQQALRIIETLRASAPQETVFLNWEAHFRKGMGQAFLRLNDRRNALQQLQQALPIWQELRKRDATNSKTLGNLNVTLLALGDIALAFHQYDEALARDHEALALVETSSAAHPADLYLRWRLADSYARLSRYHLSLATSVPPAERLTHGRAAQRYAQQSLSIWESWNQHAPTTNFDRRKREEAAHLLASCDVELAKFSAASAR